MTVAYAKVSDLLVEEFRQHFIRSGFDAKDFSREDLIKIMLTAAEFFDNEVKPMTLVQRLSVEIQV